MKKGWKKSPSQNCWEINWWLLLNRKFRKKILPNYFIALRILQFCNTLKVQALSYSHKRQKKNEKEDKIRNDRWCFELPQDFNFWRVPSSTFQEFLKLKKIFEPRNSDLTPDKYDFDFNLLNPLNLKQFLL